MQRMWFWIGTLGVCLFCGLILISIALGAIVPRVINPIAAPVVCPNGQLTITQNTTSYKPGESDTWTTDTCVDRATGGQRDVSTQTTFVAGVMYSLILFVIYIAWTLFKQLRSSLGKSTA